MASVAIAGPVHLTWDAPTTNVDGTTLTDLAGYRVYMDYAPIPDEGGTAQMIADVKDGTTTTVEVDSRPEGTPFVYFRATAYDESGNESVRSNELQLDFLPPTTVVIRFGN
jgi:hypothetical protein